MLCFVLLEECLMFYLLAQAFGRAVVGQLLPPVIALIFVPDLLLPIASLFLVLFCDIELMVVLKWPI